MSGNSHLSPSASGECRPVAPLAAVVRTWVCSAASSSRQQWTAAEGGQSCSVVFSAETSPDIWRQWEPLWNYDEGRQVTEANSDITWEDPLWRDKMPVRTEEDLGDETIVTNGGGKTIASGESTHQTTEQGKQGNKKSKVGLTIRILDDA